MGSSDIVRDTKCVWMMKIRQKIILFCGVGFSLSIEIKPFGAFDKHFDSLNSRFGFVGPLNELQ